MRNPLRRFRQAAAPTPSALSSSTARAASGWSLFRAAFSGSSSGDDKGRVLSKAWLAAVRAKNEKWTSAFAETVTEEWVAEGSSNPNTKLRDFGHDEDEGAATRGKSPAGAATGSAAGEGRDGVGRFALAVADDVDVAGFACRYGVETQLVHRVSEKDHPVIGYLRSRGATVIGKLRTIVPFALSECVHFKKFPAASALQCGACDVAVVTSIFGVAGSNGPCVSDVVTFTPSPTTFPRGTPPFSRKRSIALVFRDLHDLSSFWTELAGPGTSNGSAAGGTSIDADANDDDDAGDASSSSSSGNSAASRSLSGIGTTGDSGGLIVGVPTAWIDACFANGDGPQDVGRRFQTAYLNFADGCNDRRGTMKRRAVDRSIKVRPLIWTASPDDVLNCARTIAHYELAEALQRGGRQLDGTGLMDQLPSGLVNAIFEGRNVGDAAYAAALNVRAELAREFLEEAGEVDCVALPIIAPPYQNHNLRSVVTTLPIALSSCPAMSLRVRFPGFADHPSPNVPSGPRTGVLAAPGTTDEVPLMIAAEPGMDSALIDIVNDFFR